MFNMKNFEFLNFRLKIQKHRVIILGTHIIAVLCLDVTGIIKILFQLLQRGVAPLKGKVRYT